MEYHFLPASPALQPVFSGVWELRGPPSAERDLIAPDARPELVVHLSGSIERRIDGVDQSSSAAALAHPVSGFLALTSQGPIHIRAIRFQPAGPFLLGLSPEALRDQAVAAEDLGAALIPALADRLENPGRLDQALVEVEALIARRVAASGRAPRFDSRALNLIAAARNSIELEAVTGWTLRHLRRLTLKETGHTPAELGRLARYHRARSLILTTELEYSQIADEAGFTDQAHMTHAFKRLGGATPAALRRNAGAFNARYA